MEGAFSVARFGGGALILSCDRTGGTVTLLRPGVLDGPAPMTVITTAGARSASATPVSGPPAFAALVLTARDSVLDDMAYSRGRFAIETAGMTTLYVPSWPEVSRVVEDCR